MARPRGVAANDRATTRRLVQAAQRGDRRAADEVVRRYEPLVQRAVRRLKLPLWCHAEDLAQEARLGVVMALRSWRPERGAFPAFAQRCVRNQVLFAVISASRQKHQALNLAVSLEEKVAEDSLSADAESDPELRVLLREQIDSVLRALPTLTFTERVAISCGLSDHTNRQLALAFNMTPRAASQAAYRARRKLAEALPRAA